MTTKPDDKPARAQDPEIRILNHAVRLLDEVPEPGRQRILAYLQARYQSKYPEPARYQNNPPEADAKPSTRHSPGSALDKAAGFV